MDYKVIVVTGTNGKTTTTSMLYNILCEAHKNVITNATGANMLPGITATFVEHYSFRKSKDERFAIIEVDEANLKLFTKYVTPQYIIITNLFRDQLDRYGEVYTTLNKILQGVVNVPESKLILNGDESLLGDLSLENQMYYYGFNSSLELNKEIDINADAKFCKKCKHPYEYEFITYNHLGSFSCRNCGYKRPKLDFAMEKIVEVNEEGSLVYIDGNEYYINQAGIYNIYNALAAYSAAALMGVETLHIFNSLKRQKSSFGRQETISIDGREIKIILVKNPAGFDQAINTLKLNAKAFNLCVFLNDNYADGRDVSWIWDVNFEVLNKEKIKTLLFSGNRLYDIAIRLKIAGFNGEEFLFARSQEEFLEYTKSMEGPVYVLATYTAMTSLRKFLYQKGYIKKLW